MSSAARRTEVQAWADTVEPRVVDAAADLVNLLISAWAEPDPRARAVILSRCLTATATFTSPVAAVRGPDDVAALVGDIRVQYPGYLPTRTSAIDLHHRHARYEWAMRDRAGRAAVTGTNFILLDGTPLIEAVTSFFGPAPRVTYTYGSAR
jgi:hypothetical protein